MNRWTDTESKDTVNHLCRDSEGPSFSQRYLYPLVASSDLVSPRAPLLFLVKMF